MSPPPGTFLLYTYFRSSCSARLRIALNLKGIPYSQIPINLLKGEQLSDAHKSLNPAGSVPVLVHSLPSKNDDAGGKVTITQSMAALEYLEEIGGNSTGIGSGSGSGVTSLLPPISDPSRRAQVRALTNLITNDIQPVTNLRIQKRVKALAPSTPDAATIWARELMEDGFSAFERMVSTSAGRFCVGDRISMADVCLVPAVWGAERVGVRLEEYPVIKRVYGEMMKEEAVRRAHWRVQGDTPEELRGEPN